MHQVSATSVEAFLHSGPDLAKDLALWDDTSGKLIASALIHPGNDSLWLHFAPGADALKAVAVDWAVERLKEISLERRFIFTARTRCRDGHRELRSVLEEAGFALQRQFYWQMVRLLTPPLPTPSLTDGFQVRLLNADSDYEAVRELQQDATGVHWTQERWEAMRDDLNIAAAAPDGTLAAFCRATRVGRTAVIADVATRPAYRRLGLASAVVAETLRLSSEEGIDTATLETENQAAYQLYAKLGFAPDYRWLTYERQIDGREQTDTN